MVRDLAHSEQSGVDGGSSPETDGKEGINRREYVQMGAVGIAAILGAAPGMTGGVSASGQAEETFATDFSEYAR